MWSGATAIADVVSRRPRAAVRSLRASLAARLLRSLHASLALGLAILASAGCTAGKAGIHIVDAESSLRRAREYGADDRATYEYTLAVRYLEKAKEEHGFAEYGAAERLAKKSAEWADRAIIYVERGGGMDVEGDKFLTDETPKPQEVVTPAEPPPPAGTPTDEELFGPSSPTPPRPTPADPDASGDEPGEKSD